MLLSKLSDQIRGANRNMSKSKELPGRNTNVTVHRPPGTEILKDCSSLSAVKSTASAVSSPVSFRTRTVIVLTGSGVFPRIVRLHSLTDPKSISSKQRETLFPMSLTDPPSLRKESPYTASASPADSSAKARPATHMPAIGLIRVSAQNISFLPARRGLDAELVSAVVPVIRHGDDRCCRARQ